MNILQKMQRLLDPAVALTVGLTVLISNVLAPCAFANNPSVLSIKTRLLVSGGAGTSESAAAAEDEFLISVDEKTWIPLVTAKEGVVVLGKVVEVTDELLRMNYLFVDTTGARGLMSPGTGDGASGGAHSQDSRAQDNRAGVLETPIVRSKLNEISAFTVESGQREFNLSVLAKVQK